MNQITKKFAWDKPLNVDDTAFIDLAASLTLLHNRAPAEDVPTQQQKNGYHTEWCSNSHNQDYQVTSRPPGKGKNWPPNAKNHKQPSFRASIMLCWMRIKIYEKRGGCHS